MFTFACTLPPDRRIVKWWSDWEGSDYTERSEHHLWSFQSPPQKTAVSCESFMMGVYLCLAWKMGITQQYFINRDLATSFSSSVCNFTENRTPYHAWGNSSLADPHIFQASVKMYMTSRRTLAWDSSCSFNPKEKMILSLILFPLVLGQPLTFQWNRPRIRVPHVSKPPVHTFRWYSSISVA